jgi:RNA polymerase sigma factor (sigma-70 family)
MMAALLQLTPQVEAAIAGDHQALLAVLAAAQPDVRRYARLNCRASEVEDAVQETLWLLYRRIGSLRAAAALSGWLFAIVRRQCQRLARLAFGGAVAMDDAELERLLIARGDQELRIDLTRAIESLPLHYREMVLLRDVQELTIDEIGAAPELTRETVKARLHRARRMIREYLRD